MVRFRSKRALVYWRGHFRNIPRVIADTVTEFIDDKAIKMGASLSYFTLISLAPIMIVLIAAVGFIYGEEAAKGEIVKQVSSLVGRDGAEAVQSLILSAAAPGSGLIATIIGGSVLLFTSVAVFVELKESLNMIWGAEPVPGKVLRNLIFRRLLSFFVVLTIAALLFLSIFLSTVSTVLRDFSVDYLPEATAYLTYINAFVSIVVITTLIAMIFKLLPDVEINWRYVWFGAVVTSALFYVGKYLISLYFLHTNFGSAYGAASSLVIFLVWINYSSLILLFGAELTQVTRRYYSVKRLQAKPGFVLIRKTSALVAERVKELSNTK